MENDLHVAGLSSHSTYYMLHTTLLDILLPRACLGCKSEGSFLCANCRETIKEYNYFVCPICKRRDVYGRLDLDCREKSGLTRYFGAPLPYRSELVRKLIHNFKYNYAKDIASPLTLILIEFLNKNKFPELISKYKKRALLIPVPMYDFRERERGFNQAAEIARIISEYYSISMSPSGELEQALIKHKNTSKQADIKEKLDRVKNISGAFKCIRPEFIDNKIIILIDDVYTSGATIHECARVLRSSGASEVWGMTVARG